MEWAAIAAIVGFAVGAVTGLGGYILDAINSNQYYQQKISDTDKDKQLALADLALDFANAEEEANKNADRSDAASTMNESTLANSTNNAIDQLQINQEMQGLGFNQAAQSAGQQEGAALSDLANSGIRAGGSLSDAVEMQKSQNAMQLQLSENATRKQNELQLSNVLQGLNESVFEIQANRTDAQDLRDSFAVGELDENGNAIRDSEGNIIGGGYNWQKYQSTREQTIRGFDQQIWEYSNAKAQDEGWNAFWKGAIAVLGGGQQGVATANQIYNYASQAKPAYDTSTNYQGIGSIDYNNPFSGLQGTRQFTFKNLS